MRNRKLLVMALVFALLVTSSPMASALWGEKGGGEKPDRHKMMGKIADKLDLTKEQRAKFKERGDETKKYVEARRAEIKKLAEKLKNELEKDNPNRWAVKDSIKKINVLRTDIQLKHMDNMLELREELTPEQIEKFKEMLKKQRPKPSPAKRRKK